MDRTMYKATKEINIVPRVDIRDLEMQIKACNTCQRPLQNLNQTIKEGTVQAEINPRPALVLVCSDADQYMDRSQQ